MKKALAVLATAAAVTVASAGVANAATLGDGRSHDHHGKHSRGGAWHDHGHRSNNGNVLSDILNGDILHKNDILNDVLNNNDVDVSDLVNVGGHRPPPPPRPHAKGVRNTALLGLDLDLNLAL